jgi:hypothetical protein
MAHGTFDLANALHAPSGTFDFPSPVDLRGLATLGLTGLAVLLWSHLLTSDRDFRPGLGYIGYVNGGLMLVLFIGRLVVLDATNPVILAAAVLDGLVVSPFWFVRLGSGLMRVSRT